MHRLRTSVSEVGQTLREPGQLAAVQRFATVARADHPRICLARFAEGAHASSWLLQPHMKRCLIAIHRVAHLCWRRWWRRKRPRRQRCARGSPRRPSRAPPAPAVRLCREEAQPPRSMHSSDSPGPGYAKLEHNGCDVGLRAHAACATAELTPCTDVHGSPVRRTTYLKRSVSSIRTTTERIELLQLYKTMKNTPYSTVQPRNHVRLPAPSIALLYRAQAALHPLTLTFKPQHQVPS